jgi:hypothetical protein
MFLTSPFIDQAITLKFRLLSIQFISEAFETDRKMSASGILCHLTLRLVLRGVVECGNGGQIRL